MYFLMYFHDLYINIISLSTGSFIGIAKMPTRGARRKAAKRRAAKIPKVNEENEQEPTNRDQYDYEGNQNTDKKKKLSKGIMSSCDYVVAVIIVPQLYCMVDSQLFTVNFHFADQTREIRTRCTII